MRQIDVHCRYRVRLGELSKVDLYARLRIKIIDHIGAIFHANAIVVAG